MEESGNGEIPASATSNNSTGTAGWYGRFRGMIADELSPEYMKFLVLDYLISQGYREAAEYLCEDASIPFPRDAIENLDQRMRIRDDIVEGKIQNAIEKVVKIVPDLLERNPGLHLRLLQQHLIELIRSKMVEEAVAFTQSIVEKVDAHPEMEKEMQKAFAMIAFEKPEDSPYTYLLEMSHRQMVANDVNSAILEALNKPSAPKLENLFRLILWSKNVLKHNDTPESLERLFNGQVLGSDFHDEQNLLGDWKTNLVPWWGGVWLCSEVVLPEFGWLVGLDEWFEEGRSGAGRELGPAATTTVPRSEQKFTSHSLHMFCVRDRAFIFGARFPLQISGPLTTRLGLGKELNVGNSDSSDQKTKLILVPKSPLLLINVLSGML
ncbi:unnamed protein product [Acanthocheilonema viteae]|uniref:CTLH domain-containing protein n=1 Tax=Acanthocheilonema viteae TaxID=6277 RepID=A0A498SA22_ACAVI|nr:unnamed protein product [Acanthocheilonema viteae]